MTSPIVQPAAESAGSGWFVVQATGAATFFVGNNAQALTGLTLVNGDRLYLRGPFSFWFVPGNITITPLAVAVAEAGIGAAAFSRGGLDGPVLGS
jgi:hypothetical protein